MARPLTKVQLEFAIQRINRIKIQKERDLIEKFANEYDYYNSPDLLKSVHDILKAKKNKNNKVTLTLVPNWENTSNSYRSNLAGLFVEFEDKKYSCVSVLVKNKHKAEFADLDTLHLQIKDQLYLGDQEEALRMLQEFATF